MATCLHLGSCMPSPWLHAYRAALALAACMPRILGGRVAQVVTKYNSHRAIGRILCRQLKYLTGYCMWQSARADVPCAHRAAFALATSMTWPWHCAHGYVPWPLHAMALAACPWGNLCYGSLPMATCLAIAAACLVLGCVPMGLPWPSLHACPRHGSVPMELPWPWQRAHGEVP